jgi:hypothetical protein
LEAKTVHRRPALIQELTWRPQPVYWADRQESAKLVVFSFYNGTLYCIAVEYDRDQTEGLTSEDLVEVFSTAFGVRPSPLPSDLAAPAAYSDRQELLARWRDPLHHFDLIRSPYGAWYRLVGVREAADAAASIASQQSELLDLGEAPQREATRLAAELNAANAKSERARVVNKPKFRP